MFEHDGERMAQADQLEQLDVASVFIRLESGIQTDLRFNIPNLIPTISRTDIWSTKQMKEICRQYAASAYLQEEPVADDKMSISPLLVH